MCCFFPIPEPYSCFTPVLALSPSKGWTTLFFPFLSHSCSCPVTFKRLDNPFFHSCSCSVAFKWLDNPFFHSCPIPALALSPSKGWTTLFSISFPFLFFLCHLQTPVQPFFPSLLYSSS